MQYLYFLRKHRQYSTRMNFLYVFPLILTISLGQTFADPNVNLDQASLVETLELFSDFVRRLVIKSEIALLRSSTAILNDYVDQYLVPNINRMILDNNLDPVSVPDQEVNLGVGTSNLTEGTLSKLATIERYQDVTLTYDNSTKKLNINFILRWEDVELLFKYHTKALFIQINGNVTANIAHLKVHLNLGFNFATNHVSVDKIDFDHTGAIKIKFTGHKAVDWLTNAMTSAFTTVFHNLILSIVENVIADPVEDMVKEINEFIDHILKISV